MKTDCIETNLRRDARGYGKKHYKGKTYLHHRYVWEINNGPVPDGLFVLHSCDNPSCINIEHLSVGTHSQNMKDMYARGRYPIRRGETHKQAKLTDRDIPEIRRLASEGMSQKNIGKMFGVSQGRISQILRGRCWQQA